MGAKIEARFKEDRYGIEVSELLPGDRFKGPKGGSHVTVKRIVKETKTGISLILGYRRGGETFRRVFPKDRQEDILLEKCSGFIPVKPKKDPNFNRKVVTTFVIASEIKPKDRIEYRNEEFPITIISTRQDPNCYYQLIITFRRQDGTEGRFTCFNDANLLKVGYMYKKKKKV